MLQIAKIDSLTVITAHSNVDFSCVMDTFGAYMEGSSMSTISPFQRSQVYIQAEQFRDSPGQDYQTGVDRAAAKDMMIAQAALHDVQRLRPDSRDQDRGIGRSPAPVAK